MKNEFKDQIIGAYDVALYDPSDANLFSAAKNIGSLIKKFIESAKARNALESDTLDLITSLYDVAKNWRDQQSASRANVLEFLPQYLAKTSYLPTTEEPMKPIRHPLDLSVLQIALGFSETFRMIPPPLDNFDPNQ